MGKKERSPESARGGNEGGTAGEAGRGLRARKAAGLDYIQLN